jgi:two-component system chemotaxis sensor kinase CheA
LPRWGLRLRQSRRVVAALAPAIVLPPLAVELLEAQRRALAMPGRQDQVEDIAAVVRNIAASCGLPCPLGADHADAARVSAAIAALLDATRAASLPDAAAAPLPEGGPVGGAGGASRGEAAERTLRVEQGKVDLLMNLVGELVVAKNALPFLARDAEMRFNSRELSREIKDKYAVIDRITRQMQNAVMDIRMMPVSDLFKRFPAWCAISRASRTSWSAWRSRARAPRRTRTSSRPWPSR